MEAGNCTSGGGRGRTLSVKRAPEGKRIRGVGEITRLEGINFLLNSTPSRYQSTDAIVCIALLDGFKEFPDIAAIGIKINTDVRLCILFSKKKIHMLSLQWVGVTREESPQKQT